MSCLIPPCGPLDADVAQAGAARRHRTIVGSGRPLRTTRTELVRRQAEPVPAWTSRDDDRPTVPLPEDRDRPRPRAPAVKPGDSDPTLRLTGDDRGAIDTGRLANSRTGQQNPCTSAQDGHRIRPASVKTAAHHRSQLTHQSGQRTVPSTKTPYTRATRAAESRAGMR